MTRTSSLFLGLSFMAAVAALLQLLPALAWAHKHSTRAQQLERATQGEISEQDRRGLSQGEMFSTMTAFDRQAGWLWRVEDVKKQLAALPGAGREKRVDQVQKDGLVWTRTIVRTGTVNGEPIFTRNELETLISDERISFDRRVLWALEGVGGLRHGEAAGLRWRHYHVDLAPLGKLSIVTSYDHGRTKTSRPRDMPGHTTLAAILAEW